MFDFFDEDFPLSKKQEEEYRKHLAAQAKEKDEEAEAEKPSEPESYISMPETSVEIDDIVIGRIESEIGDEDGYDDEESDEFPALPETEPAEEKSASQIYAEHLGEIMNPETPLPVDEPEMTARDAEEPSDEQVGQKYAEENIPEVKDETAQSGEPIAEENDTAPENEAEQAEKVEEAAETEKSAAEADEIAEIPAEPIASSEIPEVEEINRRMASMDELEAHLHEELKNLGEKLDTMEKTVDEMEDGEIQEGFDYGYDERYFAEEETPAYRHPELYRKRQPKKTRPQVRKIKEKEKEQPEIIQPTDININITPATLAKAGAVIAAAVVAAKILKPKKDK